MRIIVRFKFNHHDDVVATTGVAGQIADILLPVVGDIVQHQGLNGTPFEGKVTDRIFKYELPVGDLVDGSISVTLCLDPTVVH